MKPFAPVRPQGVLAIGLAALLCLPAAAHPRTAAPLMARANARAARSPLSTVKKPLQSGYGRLPLAFEPNRGQTARQVDFLARGSGYSLFLTPTEAVFSLKHPAAKPGALARCKAQAAQEMAQSVLRMQLVGANPNARPNGMDALPGKANYFLGNDPKHWQTGIDLYRQAGYRNVYRGIDLRYYGNQRQLEYDFVVAPKADPGAVRLHFAGAQALSVSPSGDLRVQLPGGEVRWHRPVVYQEVAGRRQAVSGRYVVNGSHQVGFRVARYDTSRPLVIDPVLVYSTYLGGSPTSGNGGNDYAYSVTTDRAGNAYITGYTTSANFPTTSGAFQKTYAGFDAFVAKLNPSGTALVFSTYLGGSGNDQGLDITVDPALNVYVAGQTNSTNFPVTSNALQSTLGSTPANGADAFLTKLNPSGTALLYSTYLGGNGHDFANGVAVDAAGNAYITGETFSTNFYSVNGFQTTLGGGSTYGDAFLTRIDTTKSGAASLIYSTYLGGSGDDYAEKVDVDNAGNAYLAGLTDSTNFPTSTNAYQKAYGGGPDDAFVARIDTTKSGAASLIYSTYLGGSGDDYAYGLAIDASGNAYVTGPTQSNNFPTTQGAYQTANGGGVDAFVTKLNPTGSALVYSTYLGGSGGDLGTYIAVDGFGNAYVTGNTQSSNFPTTKNAFQTAFGGVTDAFLTKLNAAGSALYYSTYLGGSDDDEGFGVAVDPNGYAYVAGFTASTNFPVSSNAFQKSNAGGVDAFVARLRLVTRGDFNLDDNPDIVFQNPTTGQMAVWYMNGSNAFNGSYVAPVVDPNLKLVGTGDFNGDGKPDLLYENAVTGQLVVWIMNGYVATSTVVIAQTQDPSWKAVGVGDFNGDGKPDIVFQKASTGQLAVWYMNGTTVSSGAYITPTQTTGWNAFAVADFNGDGKPDIVFQNTTTGQMQVWFMNGVTETSATFISPTQNPAWQAFAAIDFNGDGKPDIFFVNPNSGQMAVWTMNGTTAVDGNFVVPAQDPGWKPLAMADLNGDGHPDIVFQNATTGRIATWFLNGATATGGAYIDPTMDPNQKASAEADFNGDGMTDLVLQNQTTGQVVIWIMNGTTAQQAITIPTSISPIWKLVASADFNGDGLPDLLFQNTNTGQLLVWFMNGTTLASTAFISQSQASGWNVVGTGDFNGDGYPDIVFQNASTGQLAVWFLGGNNGTTVTGGSYITPTQSPSYQAVAIGDYNGDGQPDIVFMNPATGQLVIWYMNGTVATGTANVTPTQDTHWFGAGPR